VFTADQVLEAIRPKNVHVPPTRLITIENTHNSAGGTIFPLDEIRRIAEIARDHDLRLHMDGARLMNAVVATGIEAREWAAPFDSVSICLSKGLGAPVGSVLCGSRELIERTHRYRKIFGGGMRQAGIIAAGGLYAIRHNVPDLAKDHQRAQRLAVALNQLTAVSINPEHAHTNIIMFSADGRLGTGLEIESQLRKAGLSCFALTGNEIRLVTHRDLTDEDIEQSIQVFQKVLG
jgi:threonine aldolase